MTVETYQWFVRNAGKISDAYTIVICDEAHTALGEKTSAAIRQWTGPVFIGMTATGALIARHVTDLFPTQTSRFDLAQAARRGVIAPLRCVRIPPGVGVRSIANVPLRRGEVDQDFDQEELAALLDQTPFNLAVADLYKTRFKDVPGVVYSAGVKHAHNVAKAFQDAGMKAKAVSGETPKRELARILAGYERGEVDVLVNAQLLAEGWNSPRATVCMHLAPTASRRIYQQRVGRVTRRTPGKEAGIVVDFVHPATPNDDPVITLHSLLDRDVYRGGAIVVGPVRRGRGRRLRVERRVVPVTADEERRAQVFERELWRMAVEHLNWGQQQAWAMLAGARVASNNWRRAKAMLHFDGTGELRRLYLLTCLRRNRNSQLRIRALTEVGAMRDPEAFDDAVEIVGGWARDERREGVKVLLQALAERQIGRRDQAARWLWHLAEYSREVHEEYAVQRWPETKRLLGLLVNSAGAAHARNARRLVQAARKQDRRLSAALLAASLAHTPEAQQVLDGARMRMARKPSALARELLRNFPKGKRRRGGRRRRKKGGGEATAPEVDATGTVDAQATDGPPDDEDLIVDADQDSADEDDAERDAARLAQQVHLAGGQRHAARAGVHEQGAALVDAGGRALSTAPAHLGPAQGVAAAPLRQHLGQRCRKPLFQSPEQGREQLLDGRRLGQHDGQRGGDLPELGREGVGGRGHVQADAEHGPPLLRPALHEDPGELAAVHQHVVGPLDPAVGRHRIGHRHRRRQRHRLGRRAQHHRQQHGGARGGDPAAPLAAASGGLLVRGHHGAVRGSPQRESLGPLVGRVHGAVVDPRARRSSRAQAHLGVGLHAEHRRRVAAVHRERERPVGVLVHEQLARRHVRERVGVGGEPPPVAYLDLHVSSQPQAAALEVLVIHVERDVAVAVAQQRMGHERPVLVRAAAAARDRTSSPGSSGSPASASSAPAAIRAATGANRSRPWKVADTGSSRCGERVTSTARDTPPQRSHARLSRPLSGPTSTRPSPVRSATARRSVPTCGSTTATCTPTGR